MAGTALAGLCVALAMSTTIASQQSKRVNFKATRVARSASSEAQRLQRFADHATANGQTTPTFTIGHRAVTGDASSSTSSMLQEVKAGSKSSSSSSSEDESTEVEATYGLLDVYDYVTEVDITDSTGTAFTVPVIMDTGSSNLAVATAACTNCEEGSTKLDLSFAKPSYCVEVTYGSGAWVGVLATDSVPISVGDLSGTAPLALTAIVAQNDFFSGGYSGIFGLAYPSLASNYVSCEMHASTTMRGASSSSIEYTKDSTLYSTTLLASWKEQGIIDGNYFGITYCDLEATLTLGEVDTSSYSGSMTYVPVEKTYGQEYAYFFVKASKMTLDGSEIDLSTSKINEYGGVLIDSGTTLTYLPSSVVKKIETSLASYDQCTKKFFGMESCLSESEASELPSMSITFGDGDSAYTFDMSWQRYLYLYNDCYYFGIAESDLPIIGNIAQQDKTIVFDIDNNQLGFADAVCSSSSELSSMAANDAAAAPISLASHESITSATSFYVGLAILGSVILVGSLVAVVRKRRQYQYQRLVDSDDIVI